MKCCYFKKYYVLSPTSGAKFFITYITRCYFLLQAIRYCSIMCIYDHACEHKPDNMFAVIMKLGKLSPSLADTMEKPGAVDATQACEPRHLNLVLVCVVVSVSVLLCIVVALAWMFFKVLHLIVTLRFHCCAYSTHPKQNLNPFSV